MNLREFLSSPVTFLAPDKALDGLDRTAAEAHLPGAPHSIAEIVAHIAFWQDWFLHVATHNAQHLGQVILLRQLRARGPRPREAGRGSSAPR